MQDDLWELRPEFGGIEYRYFYFTYVEDQIVIVHAISKKSQRLKPGDTRLALNRVEEVRRREAERREAMEKAKKDHADPESVQITPAVRRRADRG